MGVDLAFLVCGGLSLDNNYAHTQIEVGCNPEFHEKILTLPTYDPPQKIGCYRKRVDHDEFDTVYGDLDKFDAYGNLYRMVKAGDLAALTVDYDGMPLAALAYVAFLEPETMIILYWS